MRKYNIKMTLKENLQPTGEKMDNGIVSVDNFHISVNQMTTFSTK